MMRKLIETGAVALAILVMYAMYCCLFVGSEEDRWVSEHPPQGKEKDGECSEQETG